MAPLKQPLARRVWATARAAAARLQAWAAPPARRIWIAAAAVLALFMAWALWPRAQPVDTAVVDRGAVRVEITDEGRTRIHDVFVVAAPVSGRLHRVELKAGDAVTSGQVVAQISPADPLLLDARAAAEMRAAIAAAASLVRAAEADVDLATRDQERVAELRARGFASQAALDSANAALRAARANLAARRAERARAQAAASNPVGAAARTTTSVRAPAAGRVLRLIQQSETIVVAGSPIMEIGDPANLEIVADFLSQDAVNLRPGGDALIENWGGGAALAGVVERIEPFARTEISALGVEEQRVNVIIRLKDEQRAAGLGHGFRVDVRAIVAEQGDVVRAPTDALVRDGDGWAVYRVERSRARFTPVELGEGGGAHRVVRSGLDVDDVVILFPPADLTDGARVRARRPS
jgi:HlyD family secretion protein